MYESLKYFMEKYPFFLSKKSDSNFTKTKKVFNNRLQDISNNIFITYLASKLEKTVLVWKEQEDEYDYIINFIANVPLLKTVTCYKNDEVIYCESYNYEDNVNTFVYSYEDTSLNVIPDDKFLISVETWEEYTLAKGFPENDTYQDDEYDHDLSLDDFGLLYDMPRKTYTYKDNTNLADTEPPFNNRLTEDDYHYMNRLLFYISHLNDTPLPVLEIWKLFGIPLEEIEFTNREKYLCKMYSQKLHGGDDWEPEPWEHKDSMGCYSSEGLFFFVELDNPTPVVGQMINFTFTFMDMFGEKKTSDYLINVYLDDVLIKSGIDPNNDYTFDTTDVEASTLVFRFEAESESIIENLVSDDFLITLKDCHTADWYVSLNGNDTTGDGSQNNPFKTLQKALSKVEGSRNVIVLCEGEFTITTAQVISTSTSIISCNHASIRNDNTPEFFRVLQGCNLYLQNVSLEYRCCRMNDNAGFINKNITNNPIYVNINPYLVVDGVNLLCKSDVVFDLDEIVDNMYAHSNLSVSGSLSTDEEESVPVTGENVQLMEAGNVLDTDTTNNDGEFELDYMIPSVGDHTFYCKLDSDNYCEGVSEEFTVTASAMPTSLSATMDSILLWGDDLNLAYVLEDYYDNPITTGTIKLKEGNTVVASVAAGQTLTYVPPLGEHTYKVVWEAPDNSWVNCETGTFDVEVTADIIETVVTGNTVTFNDPTLITGTGGFCVDWGDGTIETSPTQNMAHSYTDGLTTHNVNIIRGTITGIGNFAFASCDSLTSVIIPDNVISIGDGAFISCVNLISCILPPNLTQLRPYVFKGCVSLTSITIPYGVTSIGGQTFHMCTSLTEIDIPASVTSIGVDCFQGCSGLTSVVIPDSVTSLGNECFIGCTSLVDYQLYWEDTDIISYVATKMPNNTGSLWIVPVGEVSNYETAGYPTGQVVERGDTITLTADKPIIQSSETSTITAKLIHDGRVASGETLYYEIKHGSTTITSGSDTTDSNGEITITYTGTAIGEVEITVSYGSLLIETFVCYDVIKFDNATSTDHNDNVWASATNITRNDEYSTIGQSGSTVMIYSSITGDICIECDVRTNTFNKGTVIRILEDSSTILSDLTRQVLNMNQNEWKHIKLTISDNKLTVDGTSIVDEDITGYNRFYFRSNSGYNIDFKNFKVYSA